MALLYKGNRKRVLPYNGNSGNAYIIEGQCAYGKEAMLHVHATEKREEKGKRGERGRGREIFCFNNVFS